MVALNTELEAVIQQIKSWPVEMRLDLARRVLETVATISTASPEGKRGRPAQDVIGLWNPGGAAPTDEECDQILVEELQRKHSP